MYNIMEQIGEMLQGVGEMLQGGLGVAPPGVLTIMQGQPVKMTVAFKYRGKALASATLRCSIGTRRDYYPYDFDEKAYASKPIGPFPASFEFTSWTAFAEIPTSGLSPSKGYDIEAKFSEYMAQTLVKIDNVIDVVGEPEFQDFRITDYSVV